MKYYITVLALIVVAFMTAGCGKTNTSNSASELEKAFQANTPAPANPEGATPDQRVQVQQAVNVAVSAMKTNGYAEAFVTLRALQAAPNITVDQYSAVENARLAVEHEVAAKAAAGDPAALKALEAIKKSGR